MPHSTPPAAPVQRRAVPPLHRAVALVASLAVAGALVGMWALTLGPSSWTVKGRVLAGAPLAGFVAALAIVSVVLAFAAVGLWRGRAWGAPALVAWWMLVASVALLVDRTASGPGAPLTAYLVGWGLKPAALAAGVLSLPHLARRTRRTRP